MKRSITAVMLVLVACGPDSRLNPDDEVTVTGRAFAEDGSALTQTRVALIKEPDLGEVLTGLTAIVGSIGTACLVDDPPELCDSARTENTDAQGAFSFELLGEDTQGSVGQASYFNLSVRGPNRSDAALGPARTERFVIQDVEIAAPDLTLWDPVVSVSVTATDAVVSSAATPEGTTSAKVSFVHAGTVLWSEDYESGGEIDGRLLEDVAGTVSITARSSDAGEGTVFEHIFESEGRAFQGAAGAPPSRGASCTATGASNTEIALEPCVLSDGDFVQAFVPPADTGCVPDGEGNGCQGAVANHSLTLDLGSVQPAELIVVRDLAAGALLERSTDGATWTEVAVEGRLATFSTPVDVRYLRIRSETDGGVISAPLRELSVW